MTCRHSLDDIKGYEVRVTITTGGTRLPHNDEIGTVGRVVQRFESATKAGAAIDLARKYRIRQGYALVDNVYSCGCVGR